MRRREFTAGLVATGVAGRARGQTDRVRRVGVLMPFAQDDSSAQAASSAFGAALRRLGWVEGRNLRLDYRFAAGDPTLFKSDAAELVALSPDVILASTPPSVLAVRQQTATIPIVFALIIDPVGQRFVESIARPGGNTTGFSFDAALMSKWLQLLTEIAPRVTRVIVLFDPDMNNVASPLFYRAVEAAAPSFAIAVTPAPVHSDDEIARAITAHADQPGGGVLALPDPFTTAHAPAIAAAALRGGQPLIGVAPMVPAGALLSYFYDLPNLYEQAAGYVDRILKGAKPAELPVQQPTKYVLTINLKTARTLGLTVPPTLLQQADEVIE